VTRFSRQCVAPCCTPGGGGGYWTWRCAPPRRRWSRPLTRVPAPHDGPTRHHGCRHAPLRGGIVTAHNGNVSLAFEQVGDDGGEPLLLVMGLGMQMIYWP